jgi:DNA repair ATPase RecN
MIDCYGTKQWLTEKMTNMLQQYEDHMKNILEDLGTALDELDEAEWDDHFEVRALIEKWRELQKEMDLLRAELRRFRKNKDEEVAKAVAEKLREMEEVIFLIN